MPEVAYFLSQADSPNAPILRTLLYDSTCTELTLQNGVDRDAQITTANLVSIKALVIPPRLDELLDAGRLELPIGRWRITASVSMRTGTCSDPGDDRVLHASVEFDVVPKGQAPLP